MGELPANPFGLFDVHGNVWEWLQDWWDPNYYYKFTEQTAIDPKGPSAEGVLRAFRGGSWNNAVQVCRSSYGYAIIPGGKDYIVGFRASLSVDAVSKAKTSAPLGRWDTPAFRQWTKDVAALPAEQQVAAVSKKLQELNSGFDGKVCGGEGGDLSVPPTIENGVVTKLHLISHEVTDISPIRALRGLKTLSCNGVNPHQGRLVDLSPQKITRGMEIIRQMKGLKMIRVNFGASQRPEEFWKKYDAGEFGKP